MNSIRIKQVRKDLYTNNPLQAGGVARGKTEASLKSILRRSLTKNHIF